MNIIKLDAIGSTNTYLKSLSNEVDLVNFTVVQAEYQSEGRGQRGSSWVTERGSSLTFSVLVKDVLQKPTDIFDLNIVVPLSVISAIKKVYGLPCKVKWPNDIVADSKKIGGILIENTFRSQGVINSIVGIGINVNQKNFSEFPQGSSLSLVLQKDIDKAPLLVAIVEALERYCKLLVEGEADGLWEDYHQKLFKKGVPSSFELPTGEVFTGVILGVSREGLLNVLLAHGEECLFNIKEIKLIY